MTRAILIAAGLAATLGCAQGGGSAHAGSQAPSNNVMVSFDNMMVNPPVAHVAQGGSVVWTSHSGEFKGIVSFPLSIAESFTCSQLGPIFSKTADRYMSIPITQDSEDVLLPCPLKPGEYDYKIDLFGGVVGDPNAGMYNPQRSLDGKIIVE